MKGKTLIAEYPFKSNFYKVGGHRIHYVDEGAGPVVVCVHGNPTWSYYYRNLIRELSQNHRVIAIDHIGCGLSDKPGEYDYTLANHVTNLQSLLKGLNISTYSLVVHDWGGAIGMGCAVKEPTQVSKVVVLNSAAFRSSRIPFRISICKLPFIGPLIVKGMNGFAWPATFMAVSKSLRKEVKDSYLLPYNSWNNRVAVSAFVKDIPLNVSHRSYSTLVEIENGLEKLSTRNVPMFIGWGGRDFCFTRHFYQEWLQRFPYAVHRYYPEGGHYILEDEFEDLAPRIKEFLSEENGSCPAL